MELGKELTFYILSGIYVWQVFFRRGKCTQVLFKDFMFCKYAEAGGEYNFD